MKNYIISLSESTVEDVDAIVEKARENPTVKIRRSTIIQLLLEIFLDSSKNINYENARDRLSLKREVSSALYEHLEETHID